MAPPRLIFVTGKGGTGKSTVAAALAVALSRNRPTTLADLDRRRSAARVLGIELNGAGVAAAGDTLEVTALSRRAELEAFIERIVPLKSISRRMLKSRTFGYVTAALPGLEAFLMLEHLRLLAGSAALEDRFVVVDGPATGNAIELLSVADGLKQLAPLGTLHRLAAAVAEFLVDPKRFGVMVTVSPEELALREAIEAIATFRDKLGMNSFAAILNGVTDALFTQAEIARLKLSGAQTRIAERRRAMATAATRARRELKRAGVTVMELPMLFKKALNRDDIETLSRELEKSLPPL